MTASGNIPQDFKTLVTAIEHTDIATIREVLESNSKQNTMTLLEMTDRDNDDSLTPLMIACFNDDATATSFVIRLLFKTMKELGGNQYIRQHLLMCDDDGYTAFFHACDNTKSDEIPAVFIDTIQSLVHDEEADEDDDEEVPTISPVSFLKSQFEIRDRFQWTAFMCACATSTADVIKLLADTLKRVFGNEYLSHQLSVKNSFGLSPLMHTADNNTGGFEAQKTVCFLLKEIDLFEIQFHALSDKYKQKLFALKLHLDKTKTAAAAAMAQQQQGTGAVAGTVNNNNSSNNNNTAISAETNAKLEKLTERLDTMERLLRLKEGKINELRSELEDMKRQAKNQQESVAETFQSQTSEIAALKKQLSSLSSSFTVFSTSSGNRDKKR